MHGILGGHIAEDKRQACINEVIDCVAQYATAISEALVSVYSMVRRYCTSLLNNAKHENI
jgi:hypothetical protein